LTVTPTNFVYKNGQEPGVIVGLIDYPRFPSNSDEIRKRAIEIGELLLHRFSQMRLSIVCPDITMTIFNDKDFNIDDIR
jgi:hypothetical protein